MNPTSLPLQSDESLPPLHPLPHVPGSMDELIALCLLANIWGEILPLALIITKTKLDWKHIKRQVEFIELGNGWVLGLHLWLTRTMFGLIDHSLLRVLIRSLPRGFHTSTLILFLSVALINGFIFLT